ncbi:alpha/beta hydrolase [Pedobacter sp. MW01-1-1]|uniref:alpha/beta hydrolase n=1 Tax=Pedobacter sp. MW01-1-1 TaxID=3383027 RepID=UPI003FF0FB6F
MKKRYKALLGSLALLLVAYLAGPKPKKPVYNEELPEVPDSKELEDFVLDMEQKVNIKPGNEAEIIWAAEAGCQKEYAVVYLHGFAASKAEGNPIHTQLAEKLGANLFLARLSEHGLTSASPMQHLTADSLWESSKQAYAIGKKLGEKVILMGTSTGASLALKLASVYPEIYSLILISPNIAIKDKNAWLLNDRWGLQIAKKVLGGDERIIVDDNLEYRKFWYTNYRVEALVALAEFVESSMIKSIFKKVTQPVLMLYYYKNELEQDPVVRVDAMLKMFDQLGTAAHLKQKIAVPEAAAHTLGSYIRSKDLINVEKAINRFVEDVLKIELTAEKKQIN